MHRRRYALKTFVFLFSLGAATSARAASPWGLDQALAPERLSTSLTLLLLLTLLSLAPALVIMVTSFNPPGGGFLLFASCPGDPTDAA
jgi:flagellar biosynthetic protein FliP